MRTGVYGGTFNPIHWGHVRLLEEFIRRLSLDRVLLIPTGLPPHKQVPSSGWICAGWQWSRCGARP